MTEREREDRLLGGREVDRRDGPFDAFWGQVTSQWGDLFSPATPSTTQASTLDVSTATQATPSQAASPPSTEDIMTTTTVVPISTVTVAETSFRTTFVTVELTTALSPSYAPVSHTETATKATACTSRSATTWPSSQTSESNSRTQGIPLPTFATSILSSRTSFTLPPANTQESASTSTETPPASASAASTTTQKHAIIGGLSGSIAGVLFIALFVCIWWRRRKPRFQEDDDDYDSKLEKGLRPMIARKWSELKSRSPKAPPPVAAAAMNRTSNRTSRSFSPSTSTNPHEDGPVLRVSLDNWAWPYAHDVGYRESQGPTTLRVMNPDLSRPNTPPIRPSMETASSFLKRQRNVLAAALYGGKVASPLGRQAPSNDIDPNLSTDFLAPKAVAPSVRSGSSEASAPVVVQQPPEDPFLTPPDERAEGFGIGGASHPTAPVEEHERNLGPLGSPPLAAASRTSPARPGISPLQQHNTPSHSAIRTLSSTLNLFSLRRNRSNASSSNSHAAPSSSLGLSRSGSTATFSSAGDPFMLDRPTPRVWRGDEGGVVMYEGT